ncbi:hypothetical protein BJ085DRAFT_16011 [Dimargaris cristalligena]|uniref:Eukaryotic translation initiation factor 3 subunit M n=1 Tax=Dimargaris cristalligena TaxID=215637 RepID=A0A4Q0A0Y1_9FUNG|nr:hypothetical protein BJ085DRAFT_16011 [Dimargaris cristalligena]|eukprot:RKP39674.1 hypothetical protein BJ085DRAFT_16011 [Dimargaris cristalligena]
MAKLSGVEKPEEAPLVQQLKAADNDTDVLVQAILPQLNLLSQTPPKEYEAVFNQFFIILKSASSEAVAKLLPEIINEVANGSTAVVPALRMKVLSNLFNILDANSALRADVLVAIVDLASTHSILRTLGSQLNKVDFWIKEWSLSPSASTQLYLSLSRALGSGRFSAQSLEFLVKGLRSVEQDPSFQSGSLQAEATQAVCKTLQSSRLYNAESLAELLPVRQLKGTKVFELLDIFLQGNLSQLQGFIAANGAELAELDLESEALVAKMRHIALAALGARFIGQSLSYNDIAAALDIPVDEVEMWTIDAIRVGLVQAKMDQVSQTVQVNRTFYRSFGKDEWAAIRKQLVHWDKSLVGILQVVGNAKLIAQQQTRVPHHPKPQSTAQANSASA